MMKTNKLVYILLPILYVNITLKAQQKSNFSFLIGANINNPHQLLENTNNTNDVNEQKAMGSVFVAIAYKNKIQLMLGNEIAESPINNNLNNDVYLSLRAYFLKEDQKLRPYAEVGYLINSYGDNSIKKESLLGFILATGMVYKLNKFVSFDLGISYNYKTYKYEVRARPSELPIEIIADRFMAKTGVIFKVF